MAKKIEIPASVRAKVENLKEIREQMANTLSNLKVDSSSYQKMLKDLQAVDAALERTQKQIDSGFSTKGQIDNFSSNINTIVRKLEDMSKIASEINFSEIVLPKDKLQEYSALTKNLQNLKNSLSALETSALSKITDNSLTLKNLLTSLKIDIKSENAESVLQKLEKELEKLDQQAASIKEPFIDKEEKQKSAAAELEQTELKAKKLANILNRTDSEFYRNNKLISKSRIATWLKENFQISDEEVNKITTDGTRQIQKISSRLEAEMKARLEKATEDKKTADVELANAMGDINNKSSSAYKLQENRAQQERIRQASKDITKGLAGDTDYQQALQDAIQRIKILEEELEQFKQAAINASGGGEQAQNSISKLGKIAKNTEGDLNDARTEIDKVAEAAKKLEQIKHTIAAWMGFNQIIQLSRRAIRAMINDIRDLDKVMTEIAVVTDMSQKDLWGQINTYQKIAKQYGVSTSGVYKVSQLYYQQGLDTNDVMKMTTETLKMAKIAGIDYAKATDYMTVAIRGFKLETSDAQKVVDVYSRVAAVSASDTEELAVAMSKTASSAAAVGSSFENTTAMLAMMIETTREAPENLGTALKSIISRYGEMKTDPSKMTDEEGEELNFNKVEAALKSVGITMHNTAGEFRDFDDVILELSKKWNTLDKNSQRYIATVMAGNRQQSRFLALVSDYDRLIELSEEAAHSEDAALVQTLKTMDSLETKIQNVKNAFQSFYANLGLEEVFKGFLDFITNLLNRLNRIPKAFNKIPILAASIAGQLITIIKTFLETALTVFTGKFTTLGQIVRDRIANGGKEGIHDIEKETDAAAKRQEYLKSSKYKAGMAVGLISSLVGSGLQAHALSQEDSINKSANVGRGIESIAGGLFTGAGQGAMTGFAVGGPYAALIGTVVGFASSLPGVITGINDLINAEQTAITATIEHAEKLKQEATLAKEETRTLENAIKKYEELSKSRYDSNESYEEWLNYKSQLIEQYPQLLEMYSAEGEAILNESKMYDLLADSRARAAQKLYEERKLELEAEKRKGKQAEKAINQTEESLRYNPNRAPEWGDTIGSGHKNIYGIKKSNNGKSFDIQTSPNGFYIPSKLSIDVPILEKIFGNKVSQGTFELQKNINFNAIKNLIPENTSKDSFFDVVGSLIYEQKIKPIKNTEWGKNNEEIKFLDEIEDPEEWVQYMMEIISHLNEDIERGVEAAKEAAELAEQQSIYENEFAKNIKERIHEADLANKKDLSEIGGDKFLLEAYTSWRNVNNDATKEQQNEYVDSLIQWYNNIDEEVYDEFVKIASHPGQFSSIEDWKIRLEKILGHDIPEEFNNYFDRMWETTEEARNNYQRLMGVENPSFDSTIKASNLRERSILHTGRWGDLDIGESQYEEFISDPSSIKEYQELLAQIGDGITENASEISADYLNNVAKQWSSLVSKNPGSISSLNNARFLAVAYHDLIGTMEEDTNYVVSGILTSAELTTRDGLKKTIEQIEEYQKNNNLSEDDANKLQQLLDLLIDRRNNLLININTEVEAYVSKVSDAIKTSNNLSKMQLTGSTDVDEIFSVFNKINANREEKFDFNQIFKFDQATRQYQLTVTGFREAYQAELGQLEEELQYTKDVIATEQNILNSGSHWNLFSEISNYNNATSDEERKKIWADKTQLEQEAYEQMALRWKEFQKSGKEGGFDAFLKEENEKLKTAEDEANQAYQTAIKLTTEQAKLQSFQAIDFVGIANGTISFAKAYESFLNYLSFLYGDKYSEEELKQYAQRLTNLMAQGGQSAANTYKEMVAQEGLEFDSDAYYSILNAPAQAANSLFNKIKDVSDNTQIQLSDAEAEFLGVEKGTILSAGTIKKSWDKTWYALAIGLQNGSVTLEELNNAIMEHSEGDRADLEQQSNDLISALSSTDGLTIENLTNLINNLNGTIKGGQFDFSKLRGLKEVDGKQIVEDRIEFLNSLNEQLTSDSQIDVDSILAAISVEEESKLNNLIVQSENSLIEGITTALSNLKGAEIGKKIDLTYLDKKYGQLLKEFFGEDYSNGILTITKEVNSNIFNFLKSMRSQYSGDKILGNALTELIDQYFSTAVNELKSFSQNMVLSKETSQLLAENSDFRKELNRDGQIVLNSAEEFIQANDALYNAAKDEYEITGTNLARLNNAFANSISSRQLQNSTSLKLLQSDNFDLASLEEFANTYGIELEKILTKAGNVQEDYLSSIERVGTNSYVISNLDKFIEDFGIEFDESLGEYIDARILFLQNEINKIGSNIGKTNLITSLVDHLENLSYEEIGSIAKMFELSVDQVLAMVVSNGNGTFNANSLLNTLEFDKNDEFYQKALTERYQSIGKNFIDAMIGYVEAPLTGNTEQRSIIETQALRTAYDNYIKSMQSLGKSVEFNFDRAALVLRKGGEDAVKLAEQIARANGTELSAEDIESLYRGQIQTFINALDTIMNQQGSIVDATTASIINESGGAAHQLGTTRQWVVDTAANLVEAYGNLYKKLATTGEATLSDLNQVAAKIFENANNESNIVSALGDAAGMTYTRFAEILTAEGKKFADYIGKDYISNLGGGKMMINNFSAFAADMGWDSNSPEYISAFKSYNDALIQMNRQVENNIKEELENLSNAKPGDQINLTQLTSELGNELVYYFGGIFENGILTLTENANIPQILSFLTNKAAETGLLLQSDVTELSDALDQLLNSYVDIIQKGINGTLTAVESLKANEIAKNLGLGDLTFISTAEGLKLSRDSAYDLYNALLKVDSVRANLVFDELAKSLEESDEKFKNISTTTAEIARLEKQLKDNGYNADLQKRLDLAKQIQSTQSQNADQFNFMGRDIPEGMKAPQNYWNSIGQAYKAINEAGSSGYMEIQDFYNIVNETASLIQMSGNTVEWMGMQFDGSAEQAALLIEKGMSALSNIDGEGVKVDMSKLGQMMNIGAADMGKGFDSAIKEMARSQIAMLDAEIQLLEGIVALEKLGEIDINGIEGIQWDEMFQNGFATPKMKEVSESIIEASKNNEDLAKALEGLKINGVTLKELFEQDEQAWLDAFGSEENAAAALTKLVNAIKDGNFLENLGNTQYIAELLGENADIVLDLDGRTIVISNGKPFEIKWDDESIQKALKYGSGRSQEELTNLITTYLSDGELNDEQKIAVHLAMNDIDVIIDDNGNQHFLDKQGNSHETLNEALLANVKNSLVGKNLSTSRIGKDEFQVQQKTELGLQYSAKYNVDGTYDFESKTEWGTFTGDTFQELEKNVLQGIIEDQFGEGITLSDLNSEQIQQLLSMNLPIDVKTYLKEQEDYTAQIEAKAKEIRDTMDAVFGGNFVEQITEIIKNAIKEGITEGILGATGETVTYNAPKVQVNGNSVFSASEDVATQQAITTVNADTSAVESAINELKKGLQEAQTIAQSIWETLEKFINQDFTTNITINKVENSTGGGNSGGNSGGSSNNSTGKLFSSITLPNVDTSGIEQNFISLNDTLNNAGNNIVNYSDDISKASSTAKQGLSDLQSQMGRLSNNNATSVSRLADAMGNIPTGVAPRVSNLTNALAKLNTSTYNLRIVVSVLGGSAVKGYAFTPGGGAYGRNINIALAKGTKRTLVGELGPELVVSNGRYFVAGQNGAEFVDLDNDAVVFNHLDTKKLLKQGHSGRGTPFTTESNAVAWAKGNTSGPAMASASSALAVLKQIRAMWQRLLDASASELGALAGRGAGGGGGGGGGGGDPTVLKAATAEIQRWYTLLQQIAGLEREITHQQTLQNYLLNDKVGNGKQIYQSYKEEIKNLNDQIAKQKELVALQRSWYDNKRKELAESWYGKIFQYDENGQQIYQGTGEPGSGLGLDILEKLYETDKEGNPTGWAVNAGKQLEYLMTQAGFTQKDLQGLLTNDDGTKIAGSIKSWDEIYDENGKRLEGQELADAQLALMDNFKNRLDGWKEELDGLFGELNDTEQESLEKQIELLELQQKMIDNQLDLENKVLQAIENREQKAIDEAQKTRDAYEESANRMIDGLTEQLNRERKMYQKNQSDQELQRLQRQLMILRRSGGSASQIRSLEEQIQAKQQDAYFDAQQEQIDAVKEASDKELERLDAQIDLMTETLEYEKEHGLLWDEVYQVMQGSPEEIANFIMDNAEGWGEKSALARNEDLIKLLDQIGIWTGYRDDKDKDNPLNPENNSSGWDTTLKSLQNLFKDKDFLDKYLDAAKKKYDEEIAKSGDPTKANEAATKFLEEKYKDWKAEKEPEKNPESTPTNPEKPTTPEQEKKWGEGNTIPGHTDINIRKSANGESLGTVDGGVYFDIKDVKDNWANIFNVRDAQNNPLSKFNNGYIYLDSRWINWKKFKKGGLIDFTGPAWVDGSKEHPEGILNAEDTALLRDYFSNSANNPTRLLLNEFRNFANEIIYHLEKQEIDPSVIIENASVNVNIESVSDDYDARRIGQIAFNEMVSIARKSGSRSLSRR